MQYIFFPESLGQKHGYTLYTAKYCNLLSIYYVSGLLFSSAISSGLFFWFLSFFFLSSFSTNSTIMILVITARN